MSIYLLNYIFDYTNLSSFHCELQVTWCVFTDKAFTTLKLFCNLYTLVLFFRYPGWMFSEIFWISNYVYFKGIIHFVHYFLYIRWKYSVCMKTFSGTIIHQFDQIRALRRSCLSFFCFFSLQHFVIDFKDWKLSYFKKNMIHVYTLYSQACTWCFLLKITYRKYPFLSNT